MSNQALFEATTGFYLKPIHAHLQDEGVTEVMVNKWDEIFIEKDGKLVRTTARFDDEATYEAAVNNILQFTGKSLSDDAALIDSRLPDGSRVHVAKKPCARFGTVMTIRKFNHMVLDMDWLVELGTLTQQAVEYLKTIVRAERNLLVAGGTSSGKTSLLNALSAFIPKGERIVVIEDSAELQLQQDHVVSMESKGPDRYGRGAVGIRELFRSSLRLRPDRIVIGEVRGGEALDMIQAMTSGHGGSMGTLHADSPRDALNRLETLALMSKVDLPLHALRSQVASAIDVVVQLSRQIGSRRMVTQISEVYPMDDSGRYVLKDLFVAEANDGEEGEGGEKSRESENRLQLQWTGERSSLAGQLRPDEVRGVTDLTREMFTADGRVVAPDPDDLER